MCSCISIEIGSYLNQIKVPLPWWMCSRDGALLTEFVGIDRCLYDEILSLWEMGITTTGHCCGHNKQEGYIGVAWHDICKMKDMGYETAYNIVRPNDEDSFIPKSGEKRVQC